MGLPAAACQEEVQSPELLEVSLESETDVIFRTRRCGLPSLARGAAMQVAGLLMHDRQGVTLYCWQDHHTVHVQAP